MAEERRFRVGTSGWVYPHWRGVFYPEGLPQARWFAFYARHFDTVEVNNTFYRLPPPGTFHRWREGAPPGFLFAVKASRFLTHIKRLREPEAPLHTFLERARGLGAHLGPVLYQLPPRFPADPERLARFLALLPPDLRHAVEFRDPSWFREEVYDLLRRHRVAFCIYDLPGQECPRVLTAPFLYLRFHGADLLYAGRYTEEQLEEWAEWLRGLPPWVEEAYIYFNNDAFGYAVENALTLALSLVRWASLGEGRSPPGFAKPMPHAGHR